MAGGNIIRFGAQIDDQVTKKLAGIRGQFDSLANSKGVGLVAQGFGLGAGIGMWNLASQAIGQATNFIKGSIDAASNLNETITKSQQIFGPAMAGMEDWAETAADAFGQSKRQALDTASTFAGLFQTVGMAADESADMAQRMTELGSDLASFFNTDVQSAIGAIRSGLAGESEPLRRFNVFLSETAVSAKAAEMGLVRAGQKLTEQQKITARYAIILEQTSAAQGDFARTSDGLANQQRSLEAQLENTQARLGEGLLPAVLAVTGAFSDLLSVLADTDDAFHATTEAADKAGMGWFETFVNLVPGARLAYEATVQLAGGGDQVAAAMERVSDRLTDTLPFNTAAQRMARFAESVRDAGDQTAKGMAAVGTAVAKSMTAIEAKMADAAIAARAAGIAIPKNLADGIRSRRNDIDAALDQLAIDLKNAMTKDAEIGRLGGLLTGKQIANGLASGDESVNASARYVVAVIEARLDELTDGAYSRGKRAALALAAGFAQSLPPNLRSELRDVVEAANEYEKIKATFDKPSGDGARLLATSLDALSKSAGGASSALADLKQKIADTQEGLKTAAGLIAQAAGQVRLFVEASGSYVDFSPKVMSVAQAAERVNTVLARVNRAISNLRTTSAGSLAAVASAFDRLKSVAMDYFDAVHRANLRQIEDARMAMMAQYDAQVGAITAEVEAYRQKLEEKRLARQEEQLKEALASAETPEDVKRATEALNDFYDDMQLRRLEQQAQAKIAELEAERSSQQKLYDAQVEAENARYEQQKAAFDKLITLLTTSLDTMKGLWDTKQKEILALLQSFVGPFAAAGQALVDAFMGALAGAGAGAAGWTPGTPSGVQKKVTSPGVLDQADIDALNRYIANLQAVQNRTPKQQAQLDMYIARLADYTERLDAAQGRAYGGLVRAGEAYRVAEFSRPEYFIPETNGRIVPLEDMGGGGGGQPVVIQVQVDGRTLAEVVDRNLFYKYRLAAKPA